VDYRSGALCIDGVPLAQLAEGRETPFFLISERRLRGDYARLAQAFAAAGVAAELRYCAKTNSEAAVLATLAGCGAGLLACHPAEVELARVCGFPASRIAYQKPVLTPCELDAVLAQGVGLVHVQLPGDLELIAAAAARAGREVRLSLRLAAPPALSPLRALSRRVGLSEHEALAVATAVRGSRWLRVVGVNVYLGTQQRSASGLARAARGAFGLVRRLAGCGVEIEEMNLGGGIPSPTLSRLTLARVVPRLLDRRLPAAPELSEAHELSELSEPRMDPFAFRLGQTFAALAWPLSTMPRLVVEPGRSLAGAAGLLVTRVRAVRGRWLFLDASRDFLPESPWLLSRPVLPATEPRSPARRFVHLSGCGLSTLDVIDLHRRLPPVAPGELLVLGDAGAYSISRAARYTGLTPAVYLLGVDGSVRLARRAETLADWTGPMTGPMTAAAAAAPPLAPALPAVPGAAAAPTAAAAAEMAWR
jgi:diaminopimelate decarboxylase